MAMVFPVTAFQSLPVLSQEAVTIRLPSGEKAASVTAFECPAKVNFSLSVPTSQILAVPSAEAVTIW